MKIRNYLSLGCTLTTLCMVPNVADAWWNYGDDGCRTNDTCCNDYCSDWNADPCSNWNFQPKGNIDLSGGYRQDELKTKVVSFSSPGVFAGTDKLRIKDISIWEIGGRGRVSLCNFYLRGFGYAGWGSHGKYTETVTDAVGDSFHSKAHVKHTRTQDALIGAGYMYMLSDCCDSSWGIGPVAGWSYAQQRVKMKDGFTDGQPDSTFDGLVYKNRWSGPWVGVDLAYQTCDYTINLGYEYHWTRWHAEWLLNDTDVTPTAFSDLRRAKNAYGNVVYLDGYWKFMSCWELGLGLRFQQWCARHGHLKPKSLTPPGVPLTEVDRVKHANWYSGEVTVNLGYTF